VVRYSSPIIIGVEPPGFFLRLSIGGRVFEDVVGQ
jgi:hypothetical protein